MCALYPMSKNLLRTSIKIKNADRAGLCPLEAKNDLKIVIKTIKSIRLMHNVPQK